MHFGGGGIYDTVVLSGVLAVILAELIGEARERMQGCPQFGERDAALIRNLRNSNLKGDK